VLRRVDILAGTIRNYYAGGNTARGFYSLFESNLQGLDRLFILKGGPGTGKSSLMKAIGKYWSGQGLDVEYIHCASDNDSIDGVVLPELKAAIVDGTAPHVIEPAAPGAVEEYVNLGEAWDSKQLAESRARIEHLTSQISAAYKEAYGTFETALKIHDEWEAIYIDHMDFSKADQLTGELMGTFFGDRRVGKEAVVKHRFLGAATPMGAVDFVPNLTEDIKKRYLIKGRPGSGKSTMLKRLASAAENRGFDVEVYHCGFDPNSLDMIILRELGIAIFDSTAPHEYFPERESDEIVDMYEIAIEAGTDERYAGALKDISRRYGDKMKEAIASLAKAKKLHDELEAIYVAAMDFGRIESIRDRIQAELEERAEAR
jgi:hypothetical protein